MKKGEDRGVETPRSPPEVDLEKLKDYLLARAEQFQQDKQWDSSFECLYVVTVINRGWYWDETGQHTVSILKER
jgi:hypothetical protein